MEYRLSKLRALSQRVIASYFQTHQKSALNRPLLSDNGLIDILNSYGGGNGMLILRSVLFFDCIHDCVLFTFDKDCRVASVQNILALLEAKDLRAAVRREFSVPWREPGSDKEQSDLEAAFDRDLPSVISRFNLLADSELGKRFQNVRNKVTAHLEMKAGEKSPRPVTAEDFGMKWGDVREFLEKVEPIIFDLEVLLTRTSYSFSSYYDAHESVSEDLWAATKKQA